MELVEDFCGLVEEEQIRIEVGDFGHVEVLRREKNCGGSARPAIFALSSGRFDGEQFGRLKIFEGYERHARQVEFAEDVASSRVK